MKAQNIKWLAVRSQPDVGIQNEIIIHTTTLLLIFFRLQQKIPSLVYDFDEVNEFFRSVTSVLFIPSKLKHRAAKRLCISAISDLSGKNSSNSNGQEFFVFAKKNTNHIEISITKTVVTPPRTPSSHHANLFDIDTYDYK